MSLNGSRNRRRDRHSQHEIELCTMSFREELQNNIQASAALIQIVSHETLRIRADCTRVSNALKRDLYIWTRPQGLTLSTDIGGSKVGDDGHTEPHEVLDWLIEHSETSTGEAGNRKDFILLLEDFHHFLSSADHALISRLRAFSMDVAGRKVSGCTVVLSQHLRKIMQQARERYDVDDRDYQESPALLRAALGLSTSEAQLAFAKVASEHSQLNDARIPLIIKEKEQVIRKSGHLEYFHPDATLDHIGGLDNLKSWLNRRSNAFTEAAQEFGLEAPRGVLLLGLPGTGKSLAAKAVANAWQLPLLRLDMGKIYGGIVGQSEGNMRAALETAEALAPSILWVDEIEKGLSGLQSSGATDGGTTSRVLGTFLTWMQEKQKPVFVVATANHIAQLPPELLRKGRVDEIFFVDLPVLQDRKEILSIHLKHKEMLDEFEESCLIELARASHGFTGAELEEAVKEGMFLAFEEHSRLRKKHILLAIENTSPLSQTMEEMISKTRQWAKGRAVAASSAEPEPLESAAKGMPRLRQEGENPFI